MGVRRITVARVPNLVGVRQHRKRLPFKFGTEIASHTAAWHGIEPVPYWGMMRMRNATWRMRADVAVSHFHVSTPVEISR